MNKSLLYFFNDLSMSIEKIVSINQTVYPIKVAKTAQLNIQRYEIIKSKTINIILRIGIMLFFIYSHLLHNLINMIETDLTVLCVFALKHQYLPWVFYLMRKS